MSAAATRGAHGPGSSVRDTVRIRSATAIVAAALPIAFGSTARAQAIHPVPPPIIGAQPRTSDVRVDGRLDEADWRVPIAPQLFRQSIPNAGALATQRTEVRVLYDDAALYVGARMHDDAGASGIRTALVRRDQITESVSDLLTVILDPMHDHRTRVVLTVAPSGAISDALGMLGAAADPAWDPVWQAATATDSTGWSAELRVPLGQLRFRPGRDQTWGVQVVRMVQRLNERTHLALWRADEAGGPQRYGHLEGVRVPTAPSRFEFLPYVVAMMSRGAPATAVAGSGATTARSGRIGGDAKWGITPTLTVDATVNPDFGQVEVDPSVVNLTVFEVFFPERRPFFTEGAAVFEQGTNACLSCPGGAGEVDLFYSRRIGRVPQGAASGTIVEQPDATTILGALKVTGQAAAGWSVGLVDAVTRGEHAVVARDPARPDVHVRVPIEPLTNYGVLSVRRELQDGAIVLGGLATSVERRLDDPQLASLLPRTARTAGIDWRAAWSARRYQVSGQLAASDVRGSDRAIARLQRTSARYFQRPDRDARAPGGLFNDAFDSTAVSLAGFAGYARVAKVGGAWLWDVEASIRSPGFEANDLGFVTRSDLMWVNTNVLRQWTVPGRFYRAAAVLAGAQQERNFDGDLTDRQARLFARITLPNFWNASTSIVRSAPALDDRRTRGGPVVHRYGAWQGDTRVSTDPRRAASVAATVQVVRGDLGTASVLGGVDVTYRPRSNVAITVGPDYAYEEAGAQYVAAGTDSTATPFFGRRYVFAELAQRTLALEARASVAFTPRLTLDVYVQPFLAAGTHRRYWEHLTPRSSARRFFTEGAELTSTGHADARVYQIDADGAGAAAQRITFLTPDFTLRALRGNAVLRWEYRPGSTLFLVWQQRRRDASADGDLRIGRDGTRLLDAPASNVVQVKISFWLGR